MAPPLHVAFIAGRSGGWKVERISAVRGESLKLAERLAVVENAAAHVAQDADWVLRGVTSNTRYTTRPELTTLVAVQAGLNRPEASCAALIPIRKSAAWWEMAQDERRAIFEEHSRHIRIGLEYLPAIARRLHHCRDLGRDLGGDFDFLTWFDYAPDHAQAFEDMLARLRDTPEWGYVEREVDIRLRRVVPVDEGG